MRILHVATLFSPDGAYGGPTRVATNQAAELVRRGHQVLLAGAGRGFERMPEQLDGVGACLVRGRQVIPGIGYAGLAAPGLLRRLTRLTSPPDVVHVHLARDLVTMPIARWALAARLPLVVQTHGMIDASERLLAKPLDLALTAPLLRAADRVYCLTESEVGDIHGVAGPSVRTTVLPNGIPQAPPADPEVDRAGVVYVGRLHARKRPMLFVRMAQEAVRRGADVDFELIGPDEGEGDAVEKALREDDGGGRIRWVGSLAPDGITPRLARAAILVNTSANERFGMSVIEAMAAGCAVVVGETCGLADVLSSNDAGLVAAETDDGFATAVVSLVEEATRLADLAGRGQQMVHEYFGIEPIVDRLEQDYHSLIGGEGH